MTVTGIHLELTSRCTLSCPRCPRTEIINSGDTLKLLDVDFDDLVNFFDIPLTGSIITMAGNLGDPIYHPRFLDIYKFFKDNGTIIKVSTNGSYRPAKWWTEFSKLVTAGDNIAFSVDGTPSNFTQYRVNGDWKSIAVAMKIMVTSTAKIVWRLIPFKFNESTINDARAIAADIGVDFVLNPSNRWLDGDDDLRPSPSMCMPRPGNTNLFAPLCKEKISTYFISADGHFYPCCMVSDYRMGKGTMFDPNNNAFLIKGSTISKMLDKTSTIPIFLQNLDNNKLPACNFCCTR